MDVTLSLGRTGLPTTVTVAGGLDVNSSNEFCQVILALHDIVGTDAIYDLTSVQVRDDAGRSTLTLLGHKFREFGRTVRLPDEDPALALS